MGAEHDAVRRLTRAGRRVDLRVRRTGRRGDRRATCARSRRPGYSALWIPEGGGSNDVLTYLSWLLGASERLTVASGIANISAREPEVLARGAAFLRETSGESAGARRRRRTRVHRPCVVGSSGTSRSTRMRAYLDVMDEAAEDLPAAPRMLAALGDGMLRLAAERSLGAHSYFVPVAHTARAREVLGDRAGAGGGAGRGAARKTCRRRASVGARVGRALSRAAELREQLASARLRRGTTSPAAARIGSLTRRSRAGPTRSSIVCARTWRRAPTTSACR